MLWKTVFNLKKKLVMPHMNDMFVNDFIVQLFNQDGKDSPIFKIKYCNPPHPIFQHLPAKEKVRDIEV